LEYANSVWNPYRMGLIKDLEKVQMRATKLVMKLKHLKYKERLKLLVMDDSRIRNRKSRFFPRIEKNINLNFLTSLCIDFYWHAIHLYSIVIMWRHVGKQEIFAVINNRILRASLQIRQLLTGYTAQGERRTIARRHPPHVSPMWSRIRERLEGRRGETVTWYTSLPVTPRRRRSTGCWPPATDDAALPSTSRKW